MTTDLHPCAGVRYTATSRSQCWLLPDWTISYPQQDPTYVCDKHLVSNLRGDQAATVTPIRYGDVTTAA